MQTVLVTEHALTFALMRQRFGPGALIIAMRDFLHLTQDTPDAAATRQVWFAWIKLDELSPLKEYDARLSDVDVAVHEMVSAGAEVRQRDFYFFVDDAGFSLCVGAPRFLDDAQRAEIASHAAPELRVCDMLVVDLPTQRRFCCRFTDIEVHLKQALETKQ
jgi:hypothetical protein